MIIALAVSAAVVVALGILIGKAFASPIVIMTATMGELAEGNLDAEVPAKERGDEIGEMAHTVQIFKDNAVEMKRLGAEQKEAEIRAEKEKS
ncbi:MAG: HAMP domain-containing protein, partial [Rhodospirillaceae bacterium]|nr:HAMP domain-containing protein [Rhodospirillaceae bacterium]